MSNPHTPASRLSHSGDDADPRLEAMLDTYGAAARASDSAPIAPAFVTSVRRRHRRRVLTHVSTAAALLLAASLTIITLRGRGSSPQPPSPSPIALAPTTSVDRVPASSILAMQLQLRGTSLDDLNPPAPTPGSARLAMDSSADAIRAGWALSESKLGSLIAVR